MTDPDVAIELKKVRKLMERIADKLNITVEPSPVRKTMSNMEKAADYSGPPCSICGNVTRRMGRCWTCMTCGESSGGCE